MTTNYNRQQALIAKQIKWEGRFFILIGIATIILLCITGCGGSNEQQDKEDLQREAQERCHELDPGLMSGPCLITDPAAFLATYGPPTTANNGH